MGLKNLKKQHKIFCDNFLLYGDKKKAAILAGFAEKNASETGNRFLKDPLIKKHLKSIEHEISEVIGISKIMVVNSLKNKAFAKITDIFNDDWSVKPLNEIHENVREAIHSIEFKDGNVKVVLHDQLKGKDMILKTMGWNEPEKTEQKVKFDKPFILKINGKDIDL